MMSPEAASVHRVNKKSKGGNPLQQRQRQFEDDARYCSACGGRGHARKKDALHSGRRVDAVVSRTVLLTFAGGTSMVRKSSTRRMRGSIGSRWSRWTSARMTTNQPQAKSTLSSASERPPEEAGKSSGRGIQDLRTRHPRPQDEESTTSGRGIQDTFPGFQLMRVLRAR